MDVSGQGAAASVSRWPHDMTAVSFPTSMPGGQPWPRISIVTPTFNQGRYIEETILSVARQGYPNLEHIVIDGGSTDETVSIIRRHEADLAYWVSEKDQGQSHAINKGMAVATGDILTWLNSDDMLAPGALAAVALAFAESGADMVAGICEIYRDGVLAARHLTACDDGPLPLDDLLDLDAGWNAGQFFYQPEVLFTRDIWRRAGGSVGEDLFYSMDYDLWLRFAENGARIHVIGRPVALFRQHDAQKTHVAERFKAELVSHRTNYIARTGHVPSRSRPEPQFGRQLRVLFLNDHGWNWGAGIAHRRVAQACAMAGCAVSAVAIAGIASEGPTVDQVLEEVIAMAPDVVLVGNLHGAGVEPAVIGAVAERWPTFVFLHDLWWVTGRCAYTGSCDKLVSGCDDSCPTPEEYPSLAPSLIHDAWADKRAVLAQPRHPVLVALSDWARDVSLRALSCDDERRVERMVLGLSTDVFRPYDRGAARRHLGLPEDKFLVLYTATDFRDRRKGADSVRRVMESLSRDDITFVTVGHGAIDDVQDRRVISIPYQTEPRDVARLYAAMDAILAPSREETLGQIYIEAAACGTPSVAFANTGVTDAVVDGVTGHLVPDGSDEDLCAVLANLRRNEVGRNDLGGWARLHAETAWSLEACYRGLFQVLRRQGVVDRLGLPHKIGFLPQAPGEGDLRSASDAMLRWLPVSGMGLEEGPYPEAGIMSRFRWLHAPGCQFDVSAAFSGPHVLALRFQNRLFAEQSMKVAIDGVEVADLTLQQRNGENFDTCVLERRLTRGRHRVSLTFGYGLDDRALALRLDNVAFHPKAPASLAVVEGH